MSVQDMILVNSNEKIEQLQNQIEEENDRLRRYEDEIRALSAQLDTAIDNYANIGAENQKLKTDIKVATTGLKEMEKAIRISAETEFNHCKQEFKATLATERAEKHVFKTDLMAKQTELANLRTNMTNLEKNYLTALEERMTFKVEWDSL